MSEENNENKIQDAEVVSTTAPEAIPSDPTKTEVIQTETATAEAPKTESPEANPEKPQVVIEKERGITYYVGFALLTVLAIVFFFIPGIALVYLVSCLAVISAPVAWIFGALLSVILWLIFKLKIKGFKKSFLWYIGLCALVSIILISLSVFTSYQILGKIFTMLIGGAN